MKRILLSSTVIAAVTIFSSAFIPSEKSTPGEEKVAHSYPDEAVKWTIDKAHSNVKFAVTHLVVSEVEGTFKLFDGSMEGTKADYSDAKINFTVDVNSIDTDNDSDIRCDLWRYGKHDGQNKSGFQSKNYYQSL